MLFPLHAGGGTEGSVCFVTFRRASVHVREQRASGEEDAFGLGLHWGLHFLCFCCTSSVADKCQDLFQLHGVASPRTEQCPSRHPAGVQTPQANRLPARLSQSELRQPLSPSLRSSQGGGPPGHTHPALAKPAADARALNSHGPRGFASRKHKK